jgi:hypothetical protein
VNQSEADAATLPAVDVVCESGSIPLVDVFHWYTNVGNPKRLARRLDMNRHEVPTHFSVAQTLAHRSSSSSSSSSSSQENLTMTQREADQVAMEKVLSQ